MTLAPFCAYMRGNNLKTESKIMRNTRIALMVGAAMAAVGLSGGSFMPARGYSAPPTTYGKKRKASRGKKYNHGGRRNGRPHMIKGNAQLINHRP